MVRLLYRSEFEAKGPWLVSDEALRDLDQIFTDTGIRLEEERQRKIQDYVERAVAGAHESVRDALRARAPADAARRFDAVASQARIVLRNGNKVIGHSIADLREHPDLAHECPTNLTLSHRDLDNNYSIELKGSTLTAEAVPSSAISQQFLSRIREWANAQGPRWWQRLWLMLVPIHWFVLIILMSATPSEVKDDGITVGLRNRATALLTDGLDNEEVPAAIETMLALNVAPPPKKVYSTRWLLAIIYVAFPLCIALSIRPRIVLGFGRGRRALRAWVAWMQFVAITAPTFVFLSFFWPGIQAKLQAMLTSQL